MPHRNLRIYAFSLPLFVELFNGHPRSFKATPETAFPSDARVLEVYSDAATDSMRVVVESQGFRAVEEGRELPIHSLNIQSI